MYPTLFLMCVPPSVSQQQIEDTMSGCGFVRSCKLLERPGGNVARLEMGTSDAVQAGVNLVSGGRVHGKTIYACAGETEIGEAFELLFLRYAEGEDQRDSDAL